MTSELTARAHTFVAERLPEARRLGVALADLIDDPESFVSTLRAGFAGLADTTYAAEQERVAPGSGAVLGIRTPLIDAVAGELRRPLAESSSSSALWLAQRLATETERELRLFSHVGLRRALADDPERSWQLMRRLARAATDWISVDSLADLYARGILEDRRRWAELEQLVFSGWRWERRLVGSTVATLPQRVPRPRRGELRGSPALTLIKSLIGDNEPDVARALSWALRSWYQVDPAGVESFIRAETAIAAATGDGFRAWVLRDALTLPAFQAPFVGEVRDRLAGIRRSHGAPPTSTAAAVAAAFSGLDGLAERAVVMQGVRQGRG